MKTVPHIFITNYHPMFIKHAKAANNSKLSQLLLVA